MKKIFVITILLLFVASFASAAQLSFSDAQAGSELGATAPVNVVIGKCSKGVKLGAAYDGTAYALQTVHLNGSKIYGTAYDSTAIWVLTPTTIAKDHFTATPLADSNSDDAFGTGWSAL
jgi:hypothetical protein